MISSRRFRSILVLLCIALPIRHWLQFSTLIRVGASSSSSKVHSPAATALPTLIIAGPAKNVQQHTARLEGGIHQILEHFNVVRMVFFENDSEDETVNILSNDWAQKFGCVVQLVHPSTSILGTERTVLLSYVRNRIWETIQSLSNSPDYVLLLDMDEVNYNLAHAEQCLNLPSDWGVCCANQYTLYYDLWALRTSNADDYRDEWMPCNWLNTCPPRITKTPIQRFRHIPAWEDPIKVDSCFGGAALYRYCHWNLAQLNLSTYEGMRTRYFRQYRKWKPWQFCEHVAFHEALTNQSSLLSLYIQPKFLNVGQPSYRLRGPAAEALRYWEPIYKNQTWQNQSLAGEVVRDTTRLGYRKLEELDSDKE